jgi:molybdopterin-guanine dinucleotide biosynthesis protein A
LTNEPRADAPLPGFAAIVLAGGASRRMGEDKAFLDFGGEPLLARVCRALAPAVEHLVVAAGAPGHALPPLAETVRVVHDAVPGGGPLAGITAALAALPASTDRVLVAAGDLPFAAANWARTLATALGPSQAVVPRVAGVEQVLAAVYRRSALEAAAAAFARGERSLRALALAEGARFLDEPALRALGIDPRDVLGVNDPDAWRQALARLPGPETLGLRLRFVLSLTVFAAALVLSAITRTGCVPFAGGLAALVTWGSGAAICALLPAATRDQARRAWLREALWLHMPWFATTACRPLYQSVVNPGLPFVGITSALFGAIWITAWANERHGLRRHETESVSFAGLAIGLLPLNAVLGVFEVLQVR